MNASRISSYTALIYSLPIVVWTSAQFFQIGYYPSTVRPTIGLAVHVLLIAQLVTIALFVPFYQYDTKPVNGLTATILLVIVPLPFFSIAALTGAIVFLKILIAQVIITVFAILYFTSAVLLARAITDKTVAAKLLIAVQLAAATVLWAAKNQWLAWLDAT